jgi:hypothetical protein
MNCMDCCQTDTVADTTMPVPTAVSTTATSRRLNDRRRFARSISKQNTKNLKISLPAIPTSV